MYALVIAVACCPLERCRREKSARGWLAEVSYARCRSVDDALDHGSHAKS